jgi:hypothetical protein
MTDKELYKLCREYGRKARKWKNKFIALLSEVGLSKLRVVANVAKKETKTMTRNALATYIKDIRPGTEQDQNVNFSLFDEQNMGSEEQNSKTQNQNMSNRERFGMDLDYQAKKRDV